jgi:hypothetical protein
LKAGSFRSPSKVAARATAKLLLAAREEIAPCDPGLWLRGGHTQTVLGHFLPSPTIEGGESLAVTLEREDERIATTYIAGQKPIVVYLFHGLGGYSHAFYMQRTARVARALGYHVYLNNHRGCGEGVGLAVEPYHSGRAEDLSAVIAFGRKRHPRARHIAIGFSLSGNALLLLAAGVRADILPDVAIAVNAPIDLVRTAERLEEGTGALYAQNFTRDLRECVRTRAATGRLKQDYKLPLFMTVRQFDEIYTAPAGGFRSAEHYYQSCSSLPYLERVRIPSVLLTTVDDPIIDVGTYRRAKLSDLIVPHIEEHGGHLGFLSAKPTPLGSRRWLDYALHEYLKVLA